MKRANPFDYPGKREPDKPNSNKEQTNPQVGNNLPPKAFKPSTAQEQKTPNHTFEQPHSHQVQEAQLSLFEIAMKEYEALKQFNSPSEFICPTTSVLPSNNNILLNLSFPIGLSISPLTQSALSTEIPTVSYGDNNIPRCTNVNCRGYLNPFVKWIQGGERWICNLCRSINNTEDYFYSEIDQFGKRKDITSRPELTNGSYEFLANKTYWKKDKTPTEAFFIFLIETSASAINSEFFNCVIEGIKAVVRDNLFFNGNKTKVAVITYDTSVHFYSCPKVNQPRMYCVSDTELFLPTTIDNLIFSVENEGEQILSILEMIQQTFKGANITCKDSSLIFDSVKGAYLLAKGKGAQLVIFSASNILTSHPIMTAGMDAKMSKEQLSYSTLDKKQLGNLGINLTNENICCDIFATAEKETNILTLNQLCEYSNGQFYYYKGFKLEVHYKNIFNQIKRVLTRPISWEGVLRTRFSHGFRISEFLTPVLLTNRDLFVFPTSDSDQHYQIIIDMGVTEEGQGAGNLTINDPFVYIQSALLYSYGDGSRRIRIHNLCMPVSARTQDIYLGVNPEALAVCYFKKTIDTLYKTKNISNSIISTETIFKTFISNILDNQMSMQKELPENLSYLPLYVLGMIKHRVFCMDEIERKYSIDLSNFLRIKLQRTSIEDTLAFIFPHIYPLHLLMEDKTYGVYEEESGMPKLPNVIAAHSSSFQPEGLYLIDNGYLLILYIKLGISKQICKSLFDVDDLQFITMNATEDTVFDSERLDDFKERVMNIVDYLRSCKALFQNMIFVFENTEGDKIIKESLIEDSFCPWYPMDYKTFFGKAVGIRLKRGNN